MAVLGEISFYRGDSYAIELTLQNTETEAPVNISGYGFKFTVNSEKNPTDDTNQIFQKDGVITDASNGDFTFTPTTTDTNLTPGKYYYDIQVVYGSIVKTIAKNNFRITQDITKT